MTTNQAAAKLTTLTQKHLAQLPRAERAENLRKLETLATSLSDPKPALVDEIGALECDPQVVAAGPKVLRLAALRKQLRAEYDHKPALKTYTVAGQKYTATIGARGHESVIDKGKLDRELGHLKFVEIAGVTLKAVRPLLSPQAASRIISVADTGPRPIQVAGKAVAQ
jgi:hypothetical protein